MYNIMEFKKEDLLTYDDIEKYLSSGEPTDRSKIICNKLKNYVFLIKKREVQEYAIKKIDMLLYFILCYSINYYNI